MATAIKHQTRYTCRIRIGTSTFGLLALGVAVGIGCGIDVVGLAPTIGDEAGAMTDAATETSSGEPIDGASDVQIEDVHVEASAQCAAWSPHRFDPCAIPAPGPAVVLPPATTLTYDTDIPGFVQDPPADPPATTIAQGGAPAVVISVDSFTIPSGTTLRVIGSKPLIIAAWTTIDIQGTLDVGSSFADKRIGAGSNPSACSATRASAGTDESDNGGGSGGGGGGGFGGSGGKGGPGDSGGQNPGGNGGQAVATPSIVRGGCSGAASGKAGPDSSVSSPSDDNTTAPGGPAGGALQLSARQSITVGATGRVLAGGAGGGGAPLNSAVGGGGGGAGGYLGFDAPAYTFTANARIAANGGAGGSSDAFNSTGEPGGDGRDDTTAATGGAAGSCATAGAPGAAGATLNGPPSSQSSVSCGGGGGGGGGGHILVFAPTFAPSTQVSFSPLPTVVP